jgi:hypothetical protein
MLLSFLGAISKISNFVMTNHTPEMSADLLCDRCGYDLRAHPDSAKCPECGQSVAESRRLATMPRRPAWRESDPRWRRRMLAGAWILVLLPLMDLMEKFGWASSVPVPAIFHFPESGCTLADTFLCGVPVYQLLLFCMGVVLLSSKERGRRSSKLDWTGRWGIICSYLTLLLGAAPIFFISALVLVGIAAVFMSMPLKYQPGVTKFFVAVGAAYLRYGPQPKNISVAVRLAFSSVTILLACVPLYDALRSSGPKRFAAALLAPLALFSLIRIAQAVYSVGPFIPNGVNLYHYELYFRTGSLAEAIGALATGAHVPGSLLGDFFVEIAKWCIVLAIAVWLSIAQFAAWRRRKNASAE